MSTVRIGCKLPNGLIMELITPNQQIMKNADGSIKEIKEMLHPAPMGQRVLLKGSNSTHTDPKENPIISRFAFTDVEESFARKWFESNKDMLFVKNGAVFIEENAKDAKAVAKDRKDVVTGMEPLNPEKDKRVHQGGVQPDKAQLKRLGVVA